MRRFLSVLLSGLFLTACFSPQTAKRYFQLQLNNNPFPDYKKLDKIILIDSVQVKQIYDDFRIIYRISPYEINYYSYDFWVKKPGKLVFDAIFDYLSKCKVFKRVEEKLSITDPDFLIKVNLNSIEEVDIGNTWYARLALEIEIRHFKSGKSIMFFNFDRKKKLSDNKVIYLPGSISQILQEELKKIIKTLVEKLNQIESENILNPSK